LIVGGILEDTTNKQSLDRIWILVYGILIGLIFSGVIVFFISPKKAYEIRLLDAATPAPFFVEVDGAVNNPGVFFVEQNLRINDLIEIAGGFREDADEMQLNLAMPIYDGMQIMVPSNKTMRSDEESENTQMNNFTDFVNINFADLEELCTLPSIGESKAQAILDYREEHGYFDSIEQIMEVPGIGEGIFSEIENLITIY
jgi:competence protein ComEA